MYSKAFKAIGFLCLCLFFCIPAAAESLPLDLSEMSIEELLDLRDQIDVQLKEKGHRIYFDLERGSKGEDVSMLQERLAQLGFYTGRITGKYDSETQKAFKAFEKANALENDGLASRADQIVLYSESAVARLLPTPPAAAVTAAPAKPTREPEHDVSFDYESCARYPEKHVGKKYKLKGKVEQVLGNRNEGFQLRFSVLGNSDEIIYVYINYDPGFKILEGDWVIIDMAMAGDITYVSVWGQEVTVPAAMASEVVLR